MIVNMSNNYELMHEIHKVEKSVSNSCGKVQTSGHIDLLFRMILQIMIYWDSRELTKYRFFPLENNPIDITILKYYYSIRNLNGWDQVRKGYSNNGRFVPDSMCGYLLKSRSIQQML